MVELVMTDNADNSSKTLSYQSTHQHLLTFSCLFFLGIMMVIPFLQPVRAEPLTPFYSEWLAIVLGLGAGVVLLASSVWEKLFAPRIALYLLGLIALIAIQYIFLKPTYMAQALLPMLYLAWATLLTVLVTWLRERLGLETVLCSFAYFILIGGLLHALFGVFQYLGVYGWLDWIIEKRKIVNITGNMGQQNHFATHIMLATLALFYIFTLRRISWSLTIFLLVLFTFVLALSGSRSVILYAIGAFVLSLLGYRKTNNSTHAQLVWLTGLLLALFLLYQYSLPWLNEWLKETLAKFGFDTGHLEVLTAAQRGAVSGIEQRLVEWHKAWLMFLSAPLLGIGIGNYGWHSFILHGLPEFATASPKSELYHHAHNFFLEVLAELGAIGMLLLLLLLVTWFKQFLRNQMNLEIWFIAAVLLTLFIHGNLEYPYWYSYFLGILVVFLALGDTRKIQIFFTLKLGQVAAAASLFLLYAILAITLIGYRQLTNVNTLILLQSPEQAARTLQTVSKNPLLTPWAESEMAAHGGLDKKNVGRQVDMTTRVVRHQPDHIKVHQQIVYLALAGRNSDALSLLKHTATAYALVFPQHICSLKRLPYKEITPLVKEGEKILGGSPSCRMQDKTRVKSFSIPSTDDVQGRETNFRSEDPESY